MAVNSVGGQYTFGTNATDKVTKSNGSNLGMDDFLKLLTAQFQNQDMMNPVSDVEFIGQMAQFSTLQGLQEISAYAQAQNAASMVGKHVTVASADSTGSIVKEMGVVETVTFFNDEPELIINGKAYPIKSVMEVHNYKTAPAGDTGKDDSSDDTNNKDSSAGVGGGNIQPALSGRMYTESVLSNLIKQASDDLYVGLPPEMWPENRR